MINKNIYIKKDDEKPFLLSNVDSKNFISLNNRIEAFSFIENVEYNIPYKNKLKININNKLIEEEYINYNNVFDIQNKNLSLNYFKIPYSVLFQCNSSFYKLNFYEVRYQNLNHFSNYLKKMDIKDDTNFYRNLMSEPISSSYFEKLLLYLTASYENEFFLTDILDFANNRNMYMELDNIEYSHVVRKNYQETLNLREESFYDLKFILEKINYFLSVTTNHKKIYSLERVGSDFNKFEFYSLPNPNKLLLK